MRRRATVISFLAIVQLFVGIKAQPVFKYAGSDTTLSGRWQWASHESSRFGERQQYWIGYSIQRLMDEDSYICSVRRSARSALGRPSLAAVVDGDTSEIAAKAHYPVGHEARIYKRMKEVAFLFVVSPTGSGESPVDKAYICTMDLAFDMESKPLIWLGASTDDESVRLLQKIFQTSRSVGLKKDLVEAVGVHQRSDEPYTFLVRLLTSNESDEVRARSAFWLSQQENPKALVALSAVARDDRSSKVREPAVFALGCLGTDAAIDTLINLAHTVDDPKVRAKAVFCLGQKASQKVVSALENIVANDQETQVQRQALLALSQIKGFDSLEMLIRIATSHPNPRIRKQAIQILGQSDDPKALEALIEIAKE